MPLSSRKVTILEKTKSQDLRKMYSVFFCFHHLFFKSFGHGNIRRVHSALQYRATQLVRTLRNELARVYRSMYDTDVPVEGLKKRISLLFNRIFVERGVGTSMYAYRSGGRGGLVHS